MRKRELEMRLQRLQPMEDPDPSLEQYATPATIAADLIFTAHSCGDIAGKRVLDLGCGNGVLGLGAWLMGAEQVTGVDVSKNALEAAERNARLLEAEMTLVESDVRRYSGEADCVVMNPPFGSQRRGADRPFLDAAMEAAPAVYSLHMAKTLPFLKKYVEERGRELAFHKGYKYDIPHLFRFHSKLRETIDIVMIIIR